MGTYGQLLRKATLLSVSRLADWCALIFIYANDEEHGSRLASMAGCLFSAIVISTLLSYLLLIGEPDRNPRWWPSFIAFAQIGALFEIYGRGREPPEIQEDAAGFRASVNSLSGVVATTVTNSVRKLSVPIRRTRRSSSGAASGSTDDADDPEDHSTVELSSMAPKKQVNFSMRASVAATQNESFMLPSDVLVQGGDEHSFNATADIDACLKVLRKMVVAQLLEVIVSSLINVYMLILSMDELYWKTVLWSSKHTLDVCDVGSSTFNELFERSPNGIIRRKCPSCELPYTELYYRRSTPMGHKGFKPYDYLARNWTRTPANRLDCSEVGICSDENDFNIYETYGDALAMRTRLPWTCDGGYKENLEKDNGEGDPSGYFSPEGSPVGFPGACYVNQTQYSRPAHRQWSYFPENVTQVDPTGVHPSSFALQYSFGFHTLREPWPAVSTNFSLHPSTCRHTSALLNTPWWIEAFILAVIAVIGLLTFGVGIADLVICAWIQTEFVQEHNHLVTAFYILDIASWLPLAVQVFHAEKSAGYIHSVGNTFRLYFPSMMLYALLILYGFFGGQMRSFRTRISARGSCRSSVVFIGGQIVLACLITPIVTFSNILFFDKSLTFKPLNQFYYPIRFAHMLWIMTIRPDDEIQWNRLAVFISITSSVLLAGVVWGVVPHRRRMREEMEAQRFLDRLAAEAEVRASMEEEEMFGKDDEEEDKKVKRGGLRRGATRTFAGSAQQSYKLNGIYDRVENAQKGIVAVLNAVGDTFEALLLASQADSPRVRSAILAVAIKPLAEAGPSVQLQLLPLILPQLLLALRWRTVDDGKDEHCPLSNFLLDRALGCQDLPLLTMVYWNLFALSADHSDSSCRIYRAVRLRLLQLLEDRAFDGRTYGEEFCETALPLLSNQRRLYYQMRAIARMAGRIQGSHTEKTGVLRAALSSSETFKRWQGVNCVGPTVVRHTTQYAHSDSSPALESQERSVFTRLASRFRDRCLFILRCCPRAAVIPPDPVKDEWEEEGILDSYENLELDLVDPQGCPLPVDPSEGVVSIDAFKCSVANSAVQPVVYCCVMADRESRDERFVSSWTKTFAASTVWGSTASFQDETQRRLFALKQGDDLRQDALVLQMFRLMEAAWAEHGLTECVLMPYQVLPVAAKEGIVAFVPNSKNISKVLAMYDGSIKPFIEHHCVRDTELGFDRLCGSVAAYSVATYLLGIGDRHLDNLMITEDGHFFHVDFGFILGEDPKPGALPVRVPREIMDVIRSTGRYDHFKHLLGEAFLLLRRTARLWTALLALTKAAGGNGVGVLADGRESPERGIHVVRQRLHLELDEAAAKEVIIQEVDDSAASMVPVVFDKLHQSGLFWH